MIAARTLFAASLLAVFLAGCGGEGGSTPSYGGVRPTTAEAAEGTSPGATQTSPEGSDEPTQPPPSREPADVPESLEFTATALDGTDFDGATLAGKPTLLWFWAPWCPVCQSQVPEVEAVAAEYDGQVNVVGVGGLDSGEAIADFAEDVDGVTHLVDEEGTLWKQFGVTEQSSYVLLDADGGEVLKTGYDEDVDLQGHLDDVVR